MKRDDLIDILRRYRRKEIPTADAAADLIDSYIWGVITAAQERFNIENARLRAALSPFANIALAQDSNKRAPDMIDGPDLAITPTQVRTAREVMRRER